MFGTGIFSGGIAAISSSAILVGSGVIAQVGPFSDSGTVERLGAAGVVVIAFGFMLKWFMDRFDLQAKALSDLHTMHTGDMKDIIERHTNEFSQIMTALRSDMKELTTAKQAQTVAMTELSMMIKSLVR